MRYRPLGTTGLSVSELSFGAGPVSGLMTGDSREDQRAVVARAIELGINWFDTAAGYGAGRSEESLGLALESLRPPQPIHVATKVRLLLNGETDLRPLVAASVRESLRRLRLPRVTLLQVHNSITPHRGDEPTSITPDDVLGPRGVLAAMEDLRAEGLVDHFGLTGIGDPDSLRLVLHSGRFATIQAPFHLLNPSALVAVPPDFTETNYGGFLRDAHDLGMGIFAIRVFAAGALLGAPPSAHTLKTPFFPLSLYERDVARATQLRETLDPQQSLQQLALRYVLSQPEIASAIIGFGAVEHVEEGVRLSATPS
ncbi:MAG: aldo/keto reductase [Planctomycetota bacterium]